MKFSSLLSLAGLAGLSALNLSASPLGAASTYNVFVFGSMSQTKTDVEGRIAVGGSASLVNFAGASQIASDPSKELVVGGSLSWVNGQLGQGGTGQGLVAGAKSTIGFGDSISNGPVDGEVDFAAAYTDLSSKSADWGAMETNGIVDIKPWNSIYLNGSDDDLNVFNLTTANLASSVGLYITADAGSTVLINVHGSAAKMQNFGFFLDGVTAENILFNFVDAKSLNMQGIGVMGSILAPNASVVFNNGQLNGQLIAKSLSGTGESHNRLFNGDFTTTPDTQTPEPSTFAMIGAGAVGVGLLRRRRAQ